MACSRVRARCGLSRLTPGRITGSGGFGDRPEECAAWYIQLASRSSSTAAASSSSALAHRPSSGLPSPPASGCALRRAVSVADSGGSAASSASSLRPVSRHFFPSFLQKSSRSIP